MKKNEQSLRNLQGIIIKHINIIEVSEKEERKGKNIWRNNKSSQEALWTPSRINSERYTVRHIIIKLFKIQKQRKTFESSKRETICYIQGILNRIDSLFHIRNHGGKTAVESHIWNAERKISSSKNSIHGKTVLQNLRWNEHIPM